VGGGELAGELAEAALRAHADLGGVLLGLVAELGDGWRVVVVACPHGRTTARYWGSARLPLTDTAVAAVALARHDAEERCACTRALRRRYGATVRGTRD
jgi:hypothetical protein